MAEMNAVIAQVAAETGVDLFDFAAAFPDDPSLFLDGRHLTAAGARLKGRLFAEHLLARGEH